MNKGLIAGIVVGLVAGAALGDLVLPYWFPSQADNERPTFYSVQNMDGKLPTQRLVPFKTLAT